MAVYPDFYHFLAIALMQRLSLKSTFKAMKGGFH